MRAAVLGALRRFDPHAIERAFEKSAKGFSLASRKAKLWEAFVVQQEKLSRDAQDDFNKVFGRDFMGAYQAAAAALERAAADPDTVCTYSIMAALEEILQRHPVWLGGCHS